MYLFLISSTDSPSFQDPLHLKRSQLKSTDREHEDKLCHPTSQPNKIWLHMGPVLITMTTIKLWLLLWSRRPFPTPDPRSSSSLEILPISLCCFPLSCKLNLYLDLPAPTSLPLIITDSCSFFFTPASCKVLLPPPFCLFFPPSYSSPTCPTWPAETAGSLRGTKATCGWLSAVRTSRLTRPSRSTSTTRSTTWDWMRTSWKLCSLAPCTASPIWPTSTWPKMKSATLRMEPSLDKPTYRWRE